MSVSLDLKPSYPAEVAAKLYPNRIQSSKIPEVDGWKATGKKV